MALFGDADPAVLENGMRGLMVMDRPETGGHVGIYPPESTCRKCRAGVNAPEKLRP
ncbi:hypothetical protein GCM10009647_062700 [Streptomyces sanglieri]